MNRGTYIAANGMMSQQQRLDVLAHNLANANTRGYKADHLQFGDMMLRTLADRSGYGDPVGQLSSGPESKTQTVDFTPGGAETTGNPLDLRLGGKTLAMFAVGHDGGTAYTRDGSFKLNAGGDLVTQGGEPVLDVGGNPIKGLTDRPTIDADGRIAGTPYQVARSVGTFAKDGGEGGLYTSTDARPASATDDAPIAAGELETSNVNPVLAMVDLISLQRSYEIAQKMIQSQDDASGKLAEAMS